MLAPGFCGGSLIAAKHVLSAGHCCEGQSTAAVSVGIYKHSVFSSTLGDACSEVIQAAAIHVNPGWTGNVLNGHDTCLIELVSQPSCFNNGGPYAINLDDGTYWPRFTAAPISTAIVAGWGSTVYGGGQAAQLQELSVNLYTAYQCDTFFAWGAGFESVVDSNLCAGHREFLPATPNRCQDPDSARRGAPQTVSTTKIRVTATAEAPCSSTPGRCSSRSASSLGAGATRHAEMVTIRACILSLPATEPGSSSTPRTRSLAARLGLHPHPSPHRCHPTILRHHRLRVARARQRTPAA